MSNVPDKSAREKAIRLLDGSLAKPYDDYTPTERLTIDNVAARMCASFGDPRDGCGHQASAAGGAA